MAAFRGPLHAWYAARGRDLPWRDSRDPYRIFLSEVILQQTRVDQGLPYYHRFLEAFPTLEALARAPLEEVLRVWEGLGYYTRARNLHAAARIVAEEHGGRIPDSMAGLRALPGVGPYTAAAVGSIAWDLPEAVLDGNVIRVLSRFFAYPADTGRSGARRALQQAAQELLAPDTPGDHNQAVMELGATVCTPVSPDCPGCPLQDVCAARAAGTQTAYPVRTPPAPVPHHEEVAAVVRRGDGAVLLRRRPMKGLLAGMWEFPSARLDEGALPGPEAVQTLGRSELGAELVAGAALGQVKHAYSHFKVTLHAWEATAEEVPLAEDAGTRPLRWFDADRIGEIPMSRLHRRLAERAGLAP